MAFVMNIDIYADGATLEEMDRLVRHSKVNGFTTNPTLMRKLGVSDYKSFAEEAMSVASNLPVSFEVLADDDKEVMRQALAIASWGDNAVVKVPCMYTSGVSTAPLIGELAKQGVKLNITAVFTPGQLVEVRDALEHGNNPIISVFAGRIADTGRDPVHVIKLCQSYLKSRGIKLLWASCRQVFDAKLAESAHCDIITMSTNQINKLELFGKDLNEYSRETVKMFFEDGRDGNYRI